MRHQSRRRHAIGAHRDAPPKLKENALCWGFIRKVCAELLHRSQPDAVEIPRRTLPLPGPAKVILFNTFPLIPLGRLFRAD
jgi:hypothetical protein